MSAPDPTDIYNALTAAGTSPAFIWYDADGRIELSGKVFANHVAKIANYLELECDLMPGSRVVLDLPPHWKSVAWALGGLVAGGFVVVGRDKVNDGEPGTVIVTATPEEVQAEDPDDLVVALNLDSFGFAWDGDLPDGVADGAAEVIAQADVLLTYGLDADSNASFWANVLNGIPELGGEAGQNSGVKHSGAAGQNSEIGQCGDPKLERLVVARPSLTEMIAVAYSAFSRGSSVVFIGDERDSAAIADTEKGTVLKL